MGLKDAENQAEKMDFNTAREQMMSQIDNEDNPETAEEAQQAEQVQAPETVADNAEQIPEETAAAQQQAVVEANQAQQDVSAIMAENTAMKAELERLKIIQSDASKNNLQNIVDEALEPPKFEFDVYDDDETAKAKQIKYANEMAEYSSKQAMKKFEPVLQKYEQDKATSETENTINTLASMPEFSDIKELTPTLKDVLLNNKAVASMDNVEEKVVTAYAIAKGLGAMHKKEPTPEEMLAMYEKNKDFRDLVEKKRIEKLPNQQVPLLSASTGASSAALNIPSKPKTLDQASQLFRNSK